MTITRNQIGGIILAGGKSSRMGYKNKALIELGDRRVIEHVIAGAKPQVASLVINANRDLALFETLGLPVIADPYGMNAGPLAGILAGMQFSREQMSDIRAVACFPADVPWFPADIVQKMRHALNSERTQVAWLCTSGQWQPLFSVWSIDLKETLAAALERGIYSPMALIRSLGNSVVTLECDAPGDFNNLNTPEDFVAAQEQLAIRN